MRIAVVVVMALCGCQDDIETPFPLGLEPFEENAVEALPDGPFDEVLRIETRNNDYIRIYARGFVHAPIDAVWAAVQSPDPNVSTCKTDQQLVTVGNELQYDYSFLIHYIVNDILTVEWDDQWRFGRITAELGMIKHQKVQGSDFISLSEGTIQVLATSDPAISELAFVEHLDSVGATVSDVVQGVQHNYDALVATVHGNPIPPCP